jgi:uncharacterized protein YxjI
VNYPIELRFKLLAIAQQISVTDARGTLLCYVRQKAFKLREAITVFGDAEQTRPLYRIEADRVLDLSARYHVTDAGGTPLGVIQRRGMRSLWRAHYEVHRDGRPLFVIREENPWVKVLDGLVGELPVIGLLSGYFLHPAYRVARNESDTTGVMRVTKQPALWEGLYRVEGTGAMSEDEERLALLAVVMMLLLERSRG